MARKLIIVIAAIVFGVIFLACDSRGAIPPRPEEIQSRQELVLEIKDFEERLGYAKTQNFLEYSPTTEAYYLCYGTGKLELPPSYTGLTFYWGDESGCTQFFDETTYDVLFYPAEAVSFRGKTTSLTQSLVEASLERFIMVIFHEDLHAQPGELPKSIEESAMTLLAYLAAREFSAERFGLASTVYQNLSADMEIALHASKIINRYHGELTKVYNSFSRGDINEQEALQLKNDIFGQLRKECEALPDSTSLGKCPKPFNNATLAFKMTYFKWYPTMYELFLTTDLDLGTSIKIIIQVSSASPTSEEEAMASIKELINKELGY